jgi:hypothetical protein
MQTACWCRQCCDSLRLSHGGVSARGRGAHLGVGVYEAHGGLVLRRAQCGRLPRLPDGVWDGLRCVRGHPRRQVLGDAARRGSGAARELRALIGGGLRADPGEQPGVFAHNGTARRGGGHIGARPGQHCAVVGGARMISMLRSGTSRRWRLSRCPCIKISGSPSESSGTPGACGVCRRDSLPSVSLLS